MITPFAHLQLRRFPLRNRETLQAWDAADELLLTHLAETTTLLQHRHAIKKPTILVVNDAFGALACSLAPWHNKSWGDSQLAHLATRYNAQHNQLPCIPDCIASTDKLSGQFDYVLIKIPKTLALLEQQLIELKQHLHANSMIVASAMSKYIHNSHLTLFEKYIGPTTTSLAVKKARLIHPTLANHLPTAQPLYPSHYCDADLQLTLYNHANVFSREKLDVGTRFFLKQFEQLPTPAATGCRLVDLGCANGVLGIMAKKYYDTKAATPVSQVYFVDESYMAIASAKINAHNAFNNLSNCQFFISDSLEQAPLSNIDLILCNPPFHQNHTLGSHIATRMFQHSKKALRQGGQLWVVANRHLHYTPILKRLFGHCRIVNKNKKFVVLAATRR